MSTAAAIGVVVTLLAACAQDIRETRVTDKNADDVLERIANSHDLTPAEARLVEAYVARRRLAVGLKQADAPRQGLSIAAILQAQRKWQRDENLTKARAEQTARESAARAKRDAEGARQLLAQSARVEALAIERTPANVWRGRYSDWIGVRMRVTNTGSKALRGLRGSLVFKNTFGQVATTVRVGIDHDLAPGETLEDVWGHDYNQFVPDDRALAQVDIARSTVEWVPVQIVFADGSGVRIPDDEGEAPPVVTPPATGAPSTDGGNPGPDGGV